MKIARYITRTTVEKAFFFEVPDNASEEDVKTYVNEQEFMTAEPRAEPYHTGVDEEEVVDRFNPIEEPPEAAVIPLDPDYTGWS
jgi:hypothetical protein